MTAGDYLSMVTPGRDPGTLPHLRTVSCGSTLLDLPLQGRLLAALPGTRLSFSASRQQHRHEDQG
jgi:hypothetical protein